MTSFNGEGLVRAPRERDPKERNVGGGRILPIWEVLDVLDQGSMDRSQQGPTRALNLQLVLQSGPDVSVFSAEL